MPSRWWLEIDVTMESLIFNSKQGAIFCQGVCMCNVVKPLSLRRFQGVIISSSTPLSRQSVLSLNRYICAWDWTNRVPRQARTGWVLPLKRQTDAALIDCESSWPLANSSVYEIHYVMGEETWVAGSRGLSNGSKTNTPLWTTSTGTHRFFQIYMFSRKIKWHVHEFN